METVKPFEMRVTSSYPPPMGRAGTVLEGYARGRVPPTDWPLRTTVLAFVRANGWIVSNRRSHLGPTLEELARG